jgi:hypothetical protein
MGEITFIIFHYILIKNVYIFIENIFLFLIFLYIYLLKYLLINKLAIFVILMILYSKTINKK